MEPGITAPAEVYQNPLPCLSDCISGSISVVRRPTVRQFDIQLVMEAPNSRLVCVRREAEPHARF